MAFDLYLDHARWRARIESMLQTDPGIVPVVKGNSYGLGRDLLTDECRELGTDTIAVGTYGEVIDALLQFDGSVLVLTPWRPFDAQAIHDDRIIHTVSRVEDITELADTHPGSRVVVEGETSMSRHGLNRHELAAAVPMLGRLVVEGFAIHLPMAGDNLAEAERWAAALETSRLSTSTLYISHLTDSELTTLRGRRPGLTIRPRIGTALWLGDLDALDVRALVLDRHVVQRGERIGYRQRPMPRDGHLLVIAGGTSHGVGLEAPRAVAGAVQRGKSLAKGGLAAAGLALSPFTIAGKQRWFAEPPHMQASMVFLPGGVPSPEVGDEVPVAVRFTIATFDRIIRR